MFKVAITGPESVGKSTLSQQLAEHFNGKFVSEFAREYVENLKRPYTYHDVEIIAKKQCDQFNAIKDGVDNNKVVFFDTFLIITKMWFQYRWKRIPDWIEKEITSCNMDLYLLCKPDIKWKDDNSRENGDIRDELFDEYKKQLEYYSFKYEIVEGVGEIRLHNATEIIEKYIVRCPQQINTQTRLSR